MKFFLDNQEIESLRIESELRQFVDMAMRWNISAFYKTITPQNKFGIFRHYVETAPFNYENFSLQLDEKLIKAKNTLAIEIDLKDTFIDIINIYLAWYKENENNFVRPKDVCPYWKMLVWMKITKNDILVRFPKIEKLNANEIIKRQKNEKRFKNSN